MESKNANSELIDKLTIEMFDLIEQQVAAKINMEAAIVDGQLLMAKSRYIKGSTSVSLAQLPTENSPEFTALVHTTVDKTDHMHAGNVRIERAEVDRENGRPDPINWFGILVPQCLSAARDRFQKAVELTAECGSIQLALQNTMLNILHLRNVNNALN